MQEKNICIRAVDGCRSRSYFISLTLKQDVVENVTKGENTLELEVLIYND